MLFFFPLQVFFFLFAAGECGGHRAAASSRLPPHGAPEVTPLPAPLSRQGCGSLPRRPPLAARRFPLTEGQAQRTRQLTPPQPAKGRRLPEGRCQRVQACVCGEKVRLPPHTAWLGCRGKHTPVTMSPLVCSPARAHFEAQLLQVYIVPWAFQAPKSSLCFSAVFENKANKIPGAACLHPIAVERGRTHLPAKPSQAVEMRQGAEGC